MNFINPFDLLEIDTPDNESIKKAKHRKLVEIELNDGFLEIGNQKLSKSEFIRLIDKLDDNKIKIMYFFVKRDTNLSNFLLNNDIRFFYFYQSHKAYQNQDFINFISPYFAESFNELLLKAFKSGSSSIIDKLFSVTLLVNNKYSDKLYINLSILLDEKIEELQKIRDSIDKDVDSIINAIKSIINIDLLNTLPNFFQKQRNKIAITLHDIFIYFWKSFNDLQFSCNIISYALRIEIDDAEIKLKLNNALKVTFDNKKKLKIIKSQFSQYGVNCLWHMTHRDNIASILKNGILNHYEAYQLNLNCVDISDPEVQRWRERIDPHYNRKIHDYAPLYINPRNPMLYVRRHLQNEICLVEVFLSALLESEYLISDGNAASNVTKFYNSSTQLDLLPWNVLNVKFWADIQDRKRKKCAEVLVYPKITPQHIGTIH